MPTFWQEDRTKIMLQRYFLEIAFKGTEFHGWQIQPRVVTVQSTVEAALERVLRVKTAVMGCGRTDTGVHATQFYLHFENNGEELLDEGLMRSLNGVLQPDIAVKRLIPVGEKTHARFDAKEREYQYFVHVNNDPFLFRRSLMLFHTLDIGEMNKAALLLLGKQDFSSFCRTGSDVKTHLCDVRKAEWIEENGRYVFTISADRFLRNMVRAIVGTLLDVGAGRMNIDQFKEVIEAKDRTKASKSALACGLYLTRVDYPFLKKDEFS